MFVRKFDLPWLRFIIEGEEAGSSAVDDDLDPEAGESVEEPTEGTEPEEEPDVPLGPAGERTLAAVKAKEKEARAELRAAKAKILELSKPAEGEQTPDQLRAEITRELRAEFNTQLVRAEVKGAATSLFADPEDALAFVDLSVIDVNDSGVVDASDIEDALKDLLARKPHLAKQGGAQSSPKRRIPEVPADPARSQASPLTHQEKIAAAQKAGDVKTVIALQNALLEAK